eukprot:gene6169-7144_t
MALIEQRNTNGSRLSIGQQRLLCDTVNEMTCSSVVMNRLTLIEAGWHMAFDVPLHELDLRGVNKLANGVEIKGWSVTTGKRPILNSAEKDSWEQELKLNALPEMIFGHNYVRVSKIDGSIAFVFNAHDALTLMRKTNDQSIKVSMAKRWQEINKDFGGSIEKSYDWTFSTPYSGSILADGHCYIALPPPFAEPTSEQIDVEKLKRPDPILFFDDRVMNDSVFLLQRFFLRVDDVVVRCQDIRLYHEFDKPYVLRETLHKEAPYEAIKGLFEKDPTAFANVNLIMENNIEQSECEVESNNVNETVENTIGKDSFEPTSETTINNTTNYEIDNGPEEQQQQQGEETEEPKSPHQDNVDGEEDEEPQEESSVEPTNTDQPPAIDSTAGTVTIETRQDTTPCEKIQEQTITTTSCEQAIDECDTSKRGLEEETEDDISLKKRRVHPQDIDQSIPVENNC